MQRGETLNRASAMQRGLVPREPIARVIRNWVAANWWMDEHNNIPSARELGSLARLAEFVGLHEDTITDILRGRKNKNWLSFDNADRIVTFIDPLLWHCDPELREIYENYDFSTLDVISPTCEAADPLNGLEDLTGRQAAAVLGVTRDLVLDRRRRQKQQLAA